MVSLLSRKSQARKPVRAAGRSRPGELTGSSGGRKARTCLEDNESHAAASGVATRRPGPTPTLSIFGRVLDHTTRQKVEFVNLTEPVEQLISESRIHNGIAVVQSLHSTAAVFVNEWQNALLDDFRALLEQAVTGDAPWRHNDSRYSDCDRGNAASHLRTLLLGTSAVLAVRSSRVMRGAWQSIILAELDGPRTRSVSLQIFGA